MRIAYCGELWHGGTSRMRLQALQRQGHTVIGLDSCCNLTGPVRHVVRAIRRTGWVIDSGHVNRKLLETVARQALDLVWVDKGLSIRPGTLKRLRALRPEIRLVHYSLDDMGRRHNQSYQYLAAVPL